MFPQPNIKCVILNQFKSLSRGFTSSSTLSQGALAILLRKQLVIEIWKVINLFEITGHGTIMGHISYYLAGYNGTQKDGLGYYFILL
jgi:hypothetical protein